MLSRGVDVLLVHVWANLRIFTNLAMTGRRTFSSIAIFPHLAAHFVGSDDVRWERWRPASG
jgi:hypothetical protein